MWAQLKDEDIIQNIINRKIDRGVDEKSGRNMKMRITEIVEKKITQTKIRGHQRIQAFIFLLLANLFCPLTALAAFQVSAQVDTEEVALGEQVTLSISIKSSEEFQVAEPRAPHLNGFNLENSFQDSSQSYQLKSQNGSMKYEKVIQVNYNYVLTPLKIGEQTIPGFEVVVDGKTVNTSPIKIQVLNPQNAGAGNRPSPSQKRRNIAPGGPNGLVPPIDDPFDNAEDLFNQFLNRRRKIPDAQSRQLNINPNEAFFVLCDVDKKEVFEGEQIVANWYLYTRGNIMALDRVRFPELKGFWKEIIEEVPALNFTEEVVNGQPYRKALLASHALFPIKPGTSVIDEYKIKAQVQVPTNPMSVFGFGKPYSFNRASDRIQITVKPLPTEGKPASFSGAVGLFEVRANIEGTEFPVNQPFSLKIRFEGQGNAKLIELPHLDLPAGIELYDTKSEAKFFKDGRSYKEFEVLLIPRSAGELKIPALQFSFFDPLQKKYVIKTTNDYNLKILPGSGPSQAPAPALPVGPAEKSPGQKLVLPEILRSPEISVGENRSQGIAMWSIIYLGILAVLVKKAWALFSGTAKSKNLELELKKRLKRVDKYIEANDWRKVGTELTNSIYFILGSLSEQGGATLEAHKLLEMIPPSVRREIGESLQKVIEMNQVLSFAPEAVVTQIREKSELIKNKKEVEKLLLRAIAIASTENSDNFVTT